MVLYNDLRLFTALKQEATKFTAETPHNQKYRKTAAEWDIYAMLALRLNHPDDAVVALNLSLSQRLSASAHLRLVNMHADAGNIKETLMHATQLVVLGDKAFVEHTYPSPISRAILQLIRKFGLVKVQNILIGMNTTPTAFKSMTYIYYNVDVSLNMRKCSRRQDQIGSGIHFKLFNLAQVK